MNYFFKKRAVGTSKGFTLIELLMVVAIISLLTSVVLASIKEAKEKAQVNAFVVQLKQVQNALELYRAEKGSYPVGVEVSLNTIISSELSAFIGPVKYPSFITDSNKIYYNSSAQQEFNCVNPYPTTSYFFRIDPTIVSGVNLKLSKINNFGFASVDENSYCITLQ